jgi:hypothetical protein
LFDGYGGGGINGSGNVDDDVSVGKGEIVATETAVSCENGGIVAPDASVSCENGGMFEA